MKRCFTVIAIAFVMSLLSAAVPAAPAPAAPMSLDAAFEQLPAYEFGKSRASLVSIEAAVQASAGDTAARQKLESRLIGAMKGNATRDSRAFVLRQLRAIGTEQCVPALAALLADKDLSHMARAALELNSSPAAGAALRDALGTVKGELLIGVVTSVGNRRDTAAVPQLAALLKNPDVNLASAAAAALGRIGGKGAAIAMAAAQPTVSAPVRAAIADAQLGMAEHMLAEKQAAEATVVYTQVYKATEAAEADPVRQAALRGLAMSDPKQATPLILGALASNQPSWRNAAADALRTVRDPASIQLVADMLPRLEPDAQVVVIGVLAATDNKTSIQAIAALAKSDSPAVRAAVARAIGVLGNARHIPLLAQLAAESKGPVQEAAASALDQLKGADVGAEMIKLIATGDAAQRSEIIRSLGARREAAAIPDLLKLAKDPDDVVAVASFNALANLAGEKEAPALVGLLATIKSEDQRVAAVDAAVAACRKIGDGKDPDLCAEPALSAFANADLAYKAALLPALARLQGPKALAALRSATKDANGQLSLYAVRALAETGDINVAPDLLELAGTAQDVPRRVLALRGYVRVIGASALRPAEKVKQFAAAMPLATRPEEKRLIIAGAAATNSADALRFLMSCMDDTTIQDEAATATLNLAKKLRGNAALTRQAAQKVAAVTKDANLRQSANDFLSGLKTQGPN